MNRHMLVWLWKHSKRTGGQRVICAIFDGWGRRGYKINIGGAIF